MQFETILPTRTGLTAPLPLYLLPPYRKLAAGFVFAVCVSLLANPVFALAGLSIPVFLAVAGRISIPFMARMLLPVNLFCLFLWLLLPLDLSSGGPAFSSQGLELAALITIKANAIAATLFALVGTSPVSDSCRGLLRLHLPEKLVTLLLLTYASLAYMANEYHRLHNAARLRGHGSGRGRIRGAAYLATMLLIRAWQRSQRVNQAMRLRGFSGRFPLLETRCTDAYESKGKALFWVVSFASACLLAADLFFKP